MKTLSIECTASPASVCVFEDGKILASSFVNVKQTHSETLLPMVESTLKSALLTINDIEGIAVAAGPGSFTGVRIGISVVKGLATPKDLPSVSVSALHSMAYMFLSEDAVICPVMDARCNQFYNALFAVENGVVKRLCDDRAILCDDLISELKSIKKKVILCGDGAEKFYEFSKGLDNVGLSPVCNRYQSAVGVAQLSYSKFINGDTISAKDILPIYLRLPQAERELKSKNKG